MSADDDTVWMILPNGEVRSTTRDEFEFGLALGEAFRAMVLTKPSEGRLPGPVVGPCECDVSDCAGTCIAGLCPCKGPVEEDDGR